MQASSKGIRRFAISSTTGKDTAFPASLYKLVSEISGKVYDDGKPWKLKHSRGVNFLMPLSSRINGTLCPPPPMFAVNVGHSLLLFSRT